MISWRDNKSLNGIRHSFLRILVALAIFLSFSGTLLSQDYTFTGMVLDPAGRPVAGAEVTITPPRGANPEQSAITDSHGRFNMRYHMSARVDEWRIWVSSGSSRRGDVLFPFSYLGEIATRFEGRHFSTGGRQGEINVGAIPVEFYFQTIAIPVRIEGRNLSKEEWQLLWCRVLDGEGRTLGDISVGPKLGSVGIGDSIFWVSLPTGRWKIEFLKFDGNTKISRDAVGATEYFEVVRDKPQTLSPVEINLKNVKMIDL